MAPIGYNSGTTFDGEGRRDYSGASVSLSDDGNKVALCAPFNDGGGLHNGLVSVFHYNGNVTGTNLVPRLEGWCGSK
jgi:hypothetical protein